MSNRSFLPILVLCMISSAFVKGAASESISWAPVIGRKDVTSEERPYSKEDRDFKKVIAMGGALILHTPVEQPAEEVLSIEIGSRRDGTSLYALGIIARGPKKMPSTSSDATGRKAPGISLQQLTILNRKIIELCLSKLKEKKPTDSDILKDLFEVVTAIEDTSEDLPSSADGHTDISILGLLPYNDKLIEIKGSIEKPRTPHTRYIDFSICGRTSQWLHRISPSTSTCTTWNPAEHKR